MKTKKVTMQKFDKSFTAFAQMTLPFFFNTEDCN